MSDVQTTGRGIAWRSEGPTSAPALLLLGSLGTTSDIWRPQLAAFSKELRASGRQLAAEALQSVDAATTVRVRNGKVSMTDGPFAETKEQLAGFYLIDASGWDEAIALAAKIPPARVGSIEVRPARELQPD